MADLSSEFQAIEPWPGVSTSDWSDWRWQFRHALATVDDFTKHIELSPEEIQGFAHSERMFKVQTTPYYAQLIERRNVYDPIRRMVIPLAREHQTGQQEMFDPLAEHKNSPARRIIHRYPDRLLFLVTDICSVYCRYCTRKHFTGHDQAFVSSAEYESALVYIRSATQVREVILSGGDPLTLSDSILERVVKDLTEISHVQLIRIGTRMPVVCPMRITPELVSRLKRYHPIYIMNHFNHPRELTQDSARALSLLADNGFPLLNQLVLLQGVNNQPEIIEELSRRLLRLRVKPYYMHQCDPSIGTDHLRTSIEDSLKLQRALWGKISGLAMPNLSVDIPGGGGKAGLVPDFVVSRNPEVWKFRGWDGIEGDYVNPTSGPTGPTSSRPF